MREIDDVHQAEDERETGGDEAFIRNALEVQEDVRERLQDRAIRRLTIQKLLDAAEIEDVSQERYDEIRAQERQAAREKAEAEAKAAEEAVAQAAAEAEATEATEAAKTAAPEAEVVPEKAAAEAPAEADKPEE